ncbi:uncharacterized protein LOC108227876 [Daucus carota subsp. sativus]|uniref:uncharacterized protein LOC108227876 n=1 Tax=Daucus carota subsp. sativus TaxID=79200 RepID=UPI0007EF2C7B|nr:PREDICTED: uncharacterized protein LOC108227876 [Daucus carota subsp. sativus]
MQKTIGKRTTITEKTQLNCKWKLIGICNNPQALAPTHKLLSNVKHENKQVTGSRRGSTDTPNLSSRPTVDDELHKSRKLLDAFDILNSNSDLFLKLLQDPNSLLMKHIESQKDMQEKTARTTTCQENNLPESGSGSALHKYQKPQHTVRKSLFDIMNEQECASKDDEIISTSNSAIAPKASQKDHRRRELGKHREEGPSSAAQMATSSECATVSRSNQRDSEAKRRLSRRLKNVGKSESVSGKETPRLTLKRILSSPKHGFVASSCPKMETEDNSLQPKNEDDSTKLAKIHETGFLTKDLSSNDCQKNLKVNDTIQSVSANLSEMPSKDSNVHSTDAEESTSTTRQRKQYQYLKCSTQDINLENQILTSSAEVPSSNHISKYRIELEGSFEETEEHLSPVSVLDSLFSEDVTSPSSKMNHPAKPQGEPDHATFEEKPVKVDQVDPKLNICSCIRTVLQASELNWKELSENSRSSGQLLNLFSVHRRDLFADFLNDVLQEVSQQNVECIRWSSFIRPDTQAFGVLGKDVVEEVMKEVHWYLVPSILPRKLEHIVRKDMEKPQCWSGRRHDTEEIVIQIVDDVLDESVMETISAIGEYDYFL